MTLEREISDLCEPSALSLPEQDFHMASHPHIIVSRSNDRMLKFVICMLLVVIAYLLFCIVSMVPEARSHFIQIFMNPSLGLFLAP